MTSTIYSVTLWGIDAFPVQIEVDVAPGLPQMILVGLPDQAVKESKERVKAAIKNSGFPFPSKKIIVNLAPADMKKEGPCFDLPIAIGILASLGHIHPEKIRDFAFLGELALDGRLRKTKGIVPAMLGIGETHRRLIVPSENEAEAGVLPDAPVLLAKNLSEVVKFLNEGAPLQAPADSRKGPEAGASAVYPFDFQEVKGQRQAKRALEVAVSGAHNILMVGPPGSGKSMLARRLPGILPEPSPEEILEIMKIHSAADAPGMGRSPMNRRPFRSPHHTISPAGLAGGGPFPRPGEITLAHHGVLFLDELSEFRKDALEILRAPMEDGKLVISRARASLTFPARFMLVTAMNPCKCGFLGDSRKACRCSLSQILAYRAKISGPLLDRIDLHVEVPAVKFRELNETLPAESSETLRLRIQRARDIQKERFESEKIATNSAMGEKEIKRYCHPTPAALKLLEAAMEDLEFSARAYSRILKIARTVADLDNSEQIQSHHIAEAIQYRSLDRQWYG